MSIGHFVWYELMTLDPKAAIEFYTDVVGWKSEAYAGEAAQAGKEPYVMWRTAQGPLGGVTTLAEQAKQMGAPPHWMAHVEVADLDATVAKAKELGGKIFVEPIAIPSIGRFSVVGDPQGAALMAFQPASAMTPHAEGLGEFVWHELYTSDNEAALAFYGALFGWRQEGAFDMGPMGTYLLFGMAGKQFGGMMVLPTGSPIPPSWGYYVRVAVLDDAIARATARGAKVVNGPHKVPDGARAVQMMDPQGVYFAMHEAARAS